MITYFVGDTILLGNISERVKWLLLYEGKNMGGDNMTDRLVRASSKHEKCVRLIFVCICEMLLSDSFEGAKYPGLPLFSPNCHS